jgi:hypothetical protein
VMSIGCVGGSSVAAGSIEFMCASLRRWKSIPGCRHTHHPLGMSYRRLLARQTRRTKGSRSSATWSTPLAAFRKGRRGRGAYMWTGSPRPRVFPAGPGSHYSAGGPDPFARLSGAGTCPYASRESAAALRITTGLRCRGR